VIISSSFLADHTNGRAYATVLRMSVVCNVCIVANWLKEQIGNGLRRIEWSRDWWRHVIQYLENTK